MRGARCATGCLIGGAVGRLPLRRRVVAGRLAVTRFDRLASRGGGHLDRLGLGKRCRALAQGAATASLLDTVGALAEVLKSTAPLAADGFAPVKDYGDRGTRSSTIIARGQPGERGGLFLHAEGRPDRTPYCGTHF